jgi:phosphate/sulfate permease
MIAQSLTLASSMFLFGIVGAMIAAGISLIYKGRILELEQAKNKREFTKKKKELAKEIKYTGCVLIGIAVLALVIGVYLMQSYLATLLQVATDNI